jgi:hypothetical protein
VQTTHDLDIERLERVTSRLDEVNTGVDAVVNNVHAVDLVLGIQVGVEALLDVFDDWAPRVVVVDKVTETRGVDDSQAQADSVLLDIGTNGLNVYGFGCEVERGLLALLGRVERGVEQGVDQSGLSEARLAWETVSARSLPSSGMQIVLTNDHNVEVEALAHTLAMPLVGQVGETDVASKLPAHNVPHVARRLGCGLGILGGNSLRCAGVAVEHRVAVLDVARRCGLAVRDGVTGRGLQRRARRGCVVERVSLGVPAAVTSAVRFEAVARRMLPSSGQTGAQRDRVIEHQRVWSLN